VLAPEAFTMSVEFVAICMDFDVTWQLNGNQITNDSNYMIITSELSSSRYKTSLLIVHSSENDAGTYTVKIISNTGSDSANITVKIISKFSLCDCVLHVFYYCMIFA